MTSNDQFILNNLNLTLEKHFAETREQLALMRKENAEFREQIKDDISAFKDDMRKEFDKVHAEIGVLHSEIAQVNTKVEVQTARIDDLVHWNYWIIALFIAFFMMPSVIEGVKAFFKILNDGLANLVKRKQTPKE